MRVKELLNFSKLIEHGKLDDISLTICCVGPFERAIPISLDNLISHGGDYKVVIKGKKLKKHIALLKQLNNAVMIPVEHKSQGVALVYYVFKTKKNQKIFDVAICGEVGSDSKIYHNIYVNGKGIKENDIFYPKIKLYGYVEIETQKILVIKSMDTNYTHNVHSIKPIKKPSDGSGLYPTHILEPSRYRCISYLSSRIFLIS